MKSRTLKIFSNVDFQAVKAKKFFDVKRKGNMKKAMLITSCLLISLSLTACGNQPTSNNENGSFVSNVTESVEQTDSQPDFDTSLIGKTFVSGEYEYTVQSDGTVFISGYTGTDQQLTVPIELDGYNVTGIADHAFHGNHTIETLDVPGQIKSIGEEAFFGCSNLTEVTLEEGVESIGRRAFSSSVEKVNIADSVYKMAEYAFENKEKVATDVNGLLYIGNVVVGFSRDTFNGHVVFAENTKGIADDAMSSSVNVQFAWTRIQDESITLPDGLLYIGIQAFKDQENVETFTVPSSVIEIGERAMLYQMSGPSSWKHNSETCKIYGEAGSAAEEYAQENDLNFVVISN